MLGVLSRKLEKAPEWGAIIAGRKKNIELPIRAADLNRFFTSAALSSKEVLKKHCLAIYRSLKWGLGNGWKKE